MGLKPLEHEKYWGLRRLPFRSLPDPDVFFPSTTHAEAKVRILHTIRTMKNAILITGRVGSGKTILWESFKKDMEISGAPISISVITNPDLGLIDLLKEMAEQVGVQDLPENKRELLKAIEKKLIQEHKKGKTPVIIIDECQVIKDREIWNELRLVLNWSYNGAPLLTFVLIGQPEIVDMILSVKELAQRISVQYCLEPLSLDETKGYINFALEKSGAERPIFSEDSINTIFSYSGGIPREINKICDHCLLFGAIKGVQTINSEIVEDVIKDIRKQGGQQERRQEKRSEAGETNYLHNKETIEIIRSDYEADVIYEEKLKDLRVVLAPDCEIANPELILRPNIPVLIRNIFSSEEIGKKALWTPEGVEDLATHCLNVSTIAVFIGKSLGYSQDELKKLALSALVHDIGMEWIPLEIRTKNERLSSEEMEIIKKHPYYSFDWHIRKITEDGETASIVLQEHEKMDGTGYPNGLKSTEIHEFSYIIGVADIFNALVHQRPYRDRLSPFEAIVALLRNYKKGFPQSILKATIKDFLFPKGSYVELNSGEIGRVISTNKENPLRPVVEIIPSKNSDHSKIVDLSREPLLFIKRNLFEIKKPE